MGAWIETSKSSGLDKHLKRRTLTWVRGLKHINIDSDGRLQAMSHPYMGAWIETTRSRDILQSTSRTLTWVRGLKR